MRIRYIVMFSLLGSAAVYRSVVAETFIPQILFGNLGVTCLGIGLAFGLNWPGIFMKTKYGLLAFPGYVLFWPFICMSHLILATYRVCSREHPIDEILPGLYLGCKLWNSDKKRLARRKISAVVDVTAEWSESSFILKNYEYLCLPVLDSYPPELEQLQQAVMWIQKQCAHGNVFVHCAAGHGRSALVIAAYLLYTGNVCNVQEALVFIRRRRPKIHLHKDQISILDDYAKHQGL